jgi:uncharacterized membrane protein
LTFAELMNHVAQAFEALSALILVAGVLWSLWLFAGELRREGSSRPGFLLLRRSFGGALLLALEVLVAADLIRTVAVVPWRRTLVTRPTAAGSDDSQVG